MVPDVIINDQLRDRLEPVPDSEERVPADGHVDAVAGRRRHLHAVALVHY